MATNNQATSTVCPCPVPKRIITSSKWLQNKNIPNIIPGSFSFSPRLNCGKQIIGNVIEKPMSSRNSCYCIEKTHFVKPTILLNRPNSCIGLKNKNKTSNNNYCICGESCDYMKTTFGGNFDRETSTLKFTGQRRDYEKYRKYEDLKFEEAIEEERRKDNIKAQKSSTLPCFRNCYCQCKENNDQEKEMPGNYLDEYITESVPEFRASHYFETHHVDTSQKYMKNGDHTCIHQYQLDENLSAKPLREDFYGRSRCKICYRPMAVNLESSCGTKSNYTRKSEFDLEEPKSRIDLILSPRDFQRMEKCIEKARMQNY